MSTLPAGVPAASLVLTLALPLTACGTANLARWGLDKPSVFTEPDNELGRGGLKPFVTIVGMPVAVGWDIATFPFQIIMQVYPYGDRFMRPDQVNGL